MLLVVGGTLHYVVALLAGNLHDYRGKSSGERVGLLIFRHTPRKFGKSNESNIKDH